MKTSIIINEKPRNLTRLQTALNQAQCRAKVRLLTIKHLSDYAAEAEQELVALNIPKRLRRGSTAYISPVRPPLAYKYRADSSCATLVRRAGGWALKSIFRTTVFPVRYGMAMGVTVTRTDGALAHEIQNDPQLDAFVRRKVAAAESEAASNAVKQVATILDPSRQDRAPLGPTIVH